jgi:hypothetical protein
MNTRIIYLLPIFVLLLFSACTKDVSIDFPDTESKTIVDGSISVGAPALLFLTRSQSFNQPLDPSSLQGLFENDAEVRLSNGTDTIQLTEICANELDPVTLALVAEQLGIEAEDLQDIDYCAYIDLLAQMPGELNTDYILDVTTIDGRLLHAETRIGGLVPLDSVWFQFWAGSDSLGFIYALLDDPAGVRNAYRWRGQRINSYPDGTQKDFGFISPFGSHFEDRFFDGLNFEIFFNRGNVPNSSAEDDNNEEDGFYKLNDTVVIEFSNTTLAAYNYWSISDDQLVNNGSPFAVPANVPSNVEGGLGLWAGYAPALDTVICVP